MRSFRALLAIALEISLLAGCTKGASVRSNDELVVAVATEPQSLNPLLLEGPIGTMVGSLIYSYLLADGPNGEMIPEVAKEVPTLRNGGISPDGRRVVYHLRRDVRWQDGAKLTARDCVFTYRAVLNPNNAIPSRYGYDDIESVTAPDDYTLVVKLAHPVRSAIDGFLAPDGNYAIMPEHLLAKYPNVNQISFNTQPVGSGPYRVVEWMHGDHVLLQANRLYFRGAPHIKELLLKFVPDSVTTLNQLRDGEVDAAFDLDPELSQQAQDIPNVRVVFSPYSGMGVLVLNAERGPTANPRVREAIASALDDKTIVAKVARGTFLARNGRRVLLLMPSGDVTQSPAYDPVRARALLDEAGWTVGSDGVRRKEGRRLELTLITSPAQPMSAAVTVLVQAALIRVGIDTTIHSYASAIYKVPASAGGPLFAGRFSLAYLLITTGDDGDLDFLYDCSQRPPQGFDISRLCDRRVDAIAEAGSQSLDPAVVRRENARLELLLEEDVPEVVLYQPQRVSAFSKRLRGFNPSAVSPYTNSWKWTLR